jgi:hypothetical protein
VRSGYGLYYGAFENRGGNPSLGYNYPFQFTLVYQSPNDTTPNRLPDGSLVGLDARAEVFNLTNTPAFNLPGSLNFEDARNFASITSMRNTPRQFQLGAKLYW